MNLGPLLFLGTFLALATSWFGFVLMPQLQIGRQDQVEASNTGQLYPPRPSGVAVQGEDVYRANGCFYCHSQQVRPHGFGADEERGWDGRQSKVQSVAQDYLFAQPVMLGSQRIGPDLANIGLRKPDAAWQFQHLYDPQTMSQGSTMPPYRFLFQKRKLNFGEKPSADALQGVKVPDGYEIVPTAEARALVTYLQSLHSEGILFETPPLTNATPTAEGASATAGTNAVAASTNSASTNVPAK